jgi:PLP dependent protein
MEFSQEQIRRNLEQVIEKITQSARRSGRSPSDIRLVVVTKSHPIEVVRAAVNAGAVILGENYTEEGLGKIQEVGITSGIEWHMIGHVQSRKVDDVVGKYSLIHSLDSFKLADRINRVAEVNAYSQDVLVQVNVSGEESKFGFPCWKDEQISSLASEIRKISSLTSINLKGFMTIPPFSESGEVVRPYFQRLRRLRDQLAEELGGLVLTELSMGMSADFEVAVEEGATLVRIGTAILGERIFNKG